MLKNFTVSKGLYVTLVVMTVLLGLTQVINVLQGHSFNPLAVMTLSANIGLIFSLAHAYVRR